MKTKQLVFGALMIALSFVLSLVTVFKAPYGGSVTAASMVPVMFYANRENWPLGIFAALCYSVVQMIQGFYPPPVETPIAYLGVILLDYVIAFGVLGLSGIFFRRFKNKTAGAIVSCTAVCVLRFLCHFASGIIIWGCYAPEGQPVWLYSLGYNGLYMLFEWIISIVVMVVLYETAPISRVSDAFGE